ncbi:Tripartite ATP-independent periplasmic transporter DctQ component [Desulfotomaculum nigrificans CO-1-SRB]|uniref:Tripartite ATP-independent periplasmic transporter DctQ component n=1 Tax=Desulfotomaculum nigrificans (strain DSM 14880 / VKM B-2319 / CO-1-SRB) TaxID=868595 RepID=F6B5D8_DESCC|nr:TRAP transporter small permease [Desulfotomaculum nigrificans]AEF94259.1 Tripartite ATP-independent periplasmic transporter DctQ component [Desulfotomaculum nigrificans CO-1-SRB]
MKKLNKIYTAFEDYFSGGMLFIGLTLVFINVIMRYFFNKPQSLLDEFSVYFVIWGTMAGLSVALRNDHHIKVDMLYNYLPLPVKRYVSIFANGLGLAFAIFFAVYGMELVQNYIIYGQRSTDSQFPLWIVNLIMPASGVMLGIRFCEKLYHLLKDNGRSWLKARRGEQRGDSVHL